MNLFGMGPMEILVIAVVALIIFGPGRLPEIGAQAGKAVRDFRKATTDLTSEFQDSINDVQATVGEMKSTVRDVQRETHALAKSVADPITGSTPRPNQANAQAPVETGVTEATATPVVPANESAPESLPEAVPTEPEVPSVSATRADPFADIAALEDDDAVVKPAGTRS